MPIIKKKKPKKLKKALVAPARSKSKKTKNTQAYLECLKACCQKGIKPKNIAQVSHECKNNALAINTKLSNQKLKAVNKIKKGYHQLGKGLDEFIRSK